MTSPTLTPPPGRLIPIDPRDVPAVISLLDWRKFDPGDWPYVVPQILPVGLVLVYGRPGVAKTTLSDQLETCVATGVDGAKVAGWRPDEPGRALVIDYEGSTPQAIKRSHRIVAPFFLPTDEPGDPDDRIMVHTTWPGRDFGERLAELDKYLRESQHNDAPVSLVRIDTLRAFLGPVPHGENTAQYDSDCLQRLNRLAVELGVCVLMIHHPNKAGEVSGSVAIEGSCTAVYRLDRKAGEDEGRLVCVKNRVGPELSWPMLFDRASGTWFITEAITDAQAANTGVRRAVLDWLVTNGPGKGPEIRAGLAGCTSDATLKNAITRLANDGWLRRDREGVWSLVAESAGAAARCEACGEPMTVTEPGQRAHPNCEPARRNSRPPIPFGPGVPGDYWLDRPAGAGKLDEDGLAGLADVVPFPRGPVEAGAVDQAAEVGDDAGELPGVEDQDQGTACPVCGLLILPDSPHDDCQDTGYAGERWPAQTELNSSIKAVRGAWARRWIAPEGDERGEGEGRQHRGLPQWQAAHRADVTVTGYSYRLRPASIEGMDPARLVVTLDKAAAYVSACQNVAAARTLLEPFGPFDCDPRALGTPNPKMKHGADGLAGVVLIECPAWDHPGIPHPLGPKARPGEPVMIPSNLLELLWTWLVDPKEGPPVMDRPRVLDSWLGRRHTGLFNSFAEAVKAAEAAAVYGSPRHSAIKLGRNIALSRMRSAEKGKGIYAPDWHAAVCGESMARLWVKGWQAVGRGAELAGMGSTDEVAYLVPADADPETWLPDGYQLGGKWGGYRRKAITLRAGRVDLSGIDPARIDADEAGKYVRISGPVPLGVWVHRA